MRPLPYPNEPSIDVGLLLAALDWPGEYVEDPITWSMIVALWRSHLCEDLREAARRAKSEEVEIIPVVISGPTSKRHTRAKGAEVEVYRTLMLRFGELREEPDSPFMRLVRVLKLRGVERHPKEQGVSARAEKLSDRLARAIEEIIATARLERASATGAARLELDAGRLFEEFGAPGKHGAVGLGIEGRTVVVSRRLITQVRRAIARHDDTTCFVDLPEAGQPRLCFRWKRGLGGLNFYSDADRSKIRHDDIAWIVYGGATIMEVVCPDRLAALSTVEAQSIETSRLEVLYPEAFKEEGVAPAVPAAPSAPAIVEAPRADLPPSVPARRSEAALKAWATRRRQGWVPTKEPRPARAEQTPDAIPSDLAQKRTEAARRAWATRRAQGWTARRPAA